MVCEFELDSREWAMCTPVKHPNSIVGGVFLVSFPATGIGILPVAASNLLGFNEAVPVSPLDTSSDEAAHADLLAK
jgi:hypothetical protein